ncbi:hypothetical protein VRK_09010 [Vibrio sp. MEBiC08052]|nr:hypothetical protein VRK_09010 [Vibrio sp. MEBiC08052]
MYFYLLYGFSAVQSTKIHNRVKKHSQIKLRIYYDTSAAILQDFALVPL